MWLIYLLIGLIVLPIVFIIAVVACGIRGELRLNGDNLSVCLKLYIFEKIEVVCFKVFVCEEKFYYQFNRGSLKVVNLNKDDEDSENGKENRKKLRLAAYLYALIDGFPRIRLRLFSLQYVVPVDDAKDRVLLDGAVDVICNGFFGVFGEKIKAMQYSLQNVRDSKDFNGAILQIKIGFSVIALLFYALKAMALKRKYTVKT